MNLLQIDTFFPFHKCHEKTTFRGIHNELKLLEFVEVGSDDELYGVRGGVAPCPSSAILSIRNRA